MKTKLSTVLVVILVISITLSGCGTSKSNDKSQPKESVKATTTQSADGRELEGNLYKTGYPIVKETETINLIGRRRHDVKPFDTLKFFDMIEEKSNVKVNWDIMEENVWNEKKNLLFASGDLPEGFYGSWVLEKKDIITYGAQGMLLPIEDYIEEYAPNLSKIFEERPEYKKQITAPDGHIYFLPSFDENTIVKTNDVLLINKNWLKKVNKEVPETTEEFYEVLKAFKEGGDLNENGKDDEIPFTFRYGEHIRGLDSFFGAFGLIDNRDHTIVKDGKVLFTAVQPEYKEAIKYFIRLYKDGLADKEAFTQDTSVITAKLKSQPPYVGAFTCWSLFWAFGDKEEYDYVPLKPLKGPKGDQKWVLRETPINNNICFAITSACEKPELLMRWADQFYDPEVGIQAHYGLYGDIINKNEDGQLNYNELPEGMSYQDFSHTVSPGVSSLKGLLKGDYKKLEDKSTREKGSYDEFYGPYFEKEIYSKAYMMNNEETEKIAILTTDINDFVKQKTAKWMLNGGIDKEWDEYVAKLNEMGLKEFIKIKQQVYDRYQ